MVVKRSPFSSSIAGGKLVWGSKRPAKAEKSTGEVLRDVVRADVRSVERVSKRSQTGRIRVHQQHEERERERKGTGMIAVLSMKSDGWLNTADNDERGEAITAAAIVRRLA